MELDPHGNEILGGDECRMRTILSRYRVDHNKGALMLKLSEMYRKDSGPLAIRIVIHFIKFCMFSSDRELLSWFFDDFIYFGEIYEGAKKQNVVYPGADLNFMKCFEQNADYTFSLKAALEMAIFASVMNAVLYNTGKEETIIKAAEFTRGIIAGGVVHHTVLGMKGRDNMFDGLFRVMIKRRVPIKLMDAILDLHGINRFLSLDLPGGGENYLSQTKYAHRMGERRELDEIRGFH